jgi:hypothetical protein
LAANLRQKNRSTARSGVDVSDVSLPLEIITIAVWKFDLGTLHVNARLELSKPAPQRVVNYR